ncbi:MAG: hypothetical protein ACREJC_03650, partial [Tepidisphaeraceae bacterium]
TGDESSKSLQFALARYLPTGKIDTSFGGAGLGLVVTDVGEEDRAFGVIQSADSGLIVAGSSDRKFALAGYTADGVLKSSFGSGGKVITDFTSAGFVQFFVGLAKGPGRRFVVVGGTSFKTARYLDAGANVVSVGALRTLTTEGAGDFGSLLVTRTERLPTTTRIFFNIGGTASGPGFGVPRPDYGLDGMTIPSPFGSERRPSVDIPPNQTFVIVKLTPRDNSTVEGPETATFSILPDASYEIGTNPDTEIDIADNDVVHINFQTDTATRPTGYLADVGLPFGVHDAGLQYGWDADNSKNVRVRNNARSPDARYDTQARMQAGGVKRTWEIAIPNGLYEVRLVAGDPNLTDSIYKTDLEGIRSLTGKPRNDIRWIRHTVNVQVNDGRLTLSNGVGASNNKIAFIDIKGANVGSKPGNITNDIAVHLLPPPTAQSFSMAWRPITHSIFSDERIEELV